MKKGQLNKTDKVHLSAGIVNAGDHQSQNCTKLQVVLVAKLVDLLVKLFDRLKVDMTHCASFVGLSEKYLIANL